VSPLKYQLDNAVGIEEKIAVYSRKRTKATNTQYAQHLEFFHVKAGATLR
jgi:hypothetical protein